MKSSWPLLAIPVLALLLFLGAKPIAPATEATLRSDSESRAQLEVLRTALASVDSIHFKAVYDIERMDATGQRAVGGGVYEFWWSDGSYRVTSRTDASLGLAADFEFAFDGDTYSFSYPELSLLSLSTEAPAELPTSLPNPLLLPFDMLSRGSPRCSNCNIQFGDLQNDEYWTSQGLNVELGERAKTGQLQLDSERISYSVNRNAGIAFPSRVEMRDEEARATALLEAEFAGSVSSLPAALQIPAKLRLVTSEASGSTLIATIRVEEISVDQAIPQGALNIDTREVEKIWDADQRFFLRHPQLPVINSRIE